MKTVSLYPLACSKCGYYKPQGRRGGMCEQLAVPVQGGWTSCPLAVHPFSNSWTNLKDIVSLENSLSLQSQLDNSLVEKTLNSQSPTTELV